MNSQTPVPDVLCLRVFTSPRSPGACRKVHPEPVEGQIISWGSFMVRIPLLTEPFILRGPQDQRRAEGVTVKGHTIHRIYRRYTPRISFQKEGGKQIRRTPYFSPENRVFLWGWDRSIGDRGRIRSIPSSLLRVFRQVSFYKNIQYVFQVILELADNRFRN